MPASGGWATLQLAEFLESVSSYDDSAAAMRGAVERSAEALDGEFAAIVSGSSMLTSIGFARGGAGQAELIAAARAGQLTDADLPHVGRCHVVAVPLDDHEGRLVVARRSGDPFDAVEVSLLRGMARGLSQTLRTLRVIDAERALRAEAERHSVERDRLLAAATERQQLLERLARIQRSISHRAPLQDVFDAITSGAQALLGDEVVGLRLIDPDDPRAFVLMSSCGLNDALRDALHRGPVSQGAGGRAITENRLVIVEDYSAQDEAIPALRADGLGAAMAAPVHEHGDVAGSLVVASYRHDRRYSPSEQEALLAFAEHASLALTDARTVESLRDAHRAKDLFLAMVSHELKTPLTVVMGALRTLQTHGATLPQDTREQMLSAAFARGRELERLIDRLLRGARAELAGVRRVAGLPELIDVAVCGFDHVRRLVVTDVPGVDVDLDADAFEETIGILVENAVSHSPADTSVIICTSVVDRDVRVSVSNSGLLPDDVDPSTLFQPFHRGADVRSAGVGLGLYIAARQAESLGGRIDAETSDGCVVFTLVVPEVVTGPSAPSTVSVVDAPSAARSTT